MAIQHQDNRPNTFEWKVKNDFAHVDSRYLKSNTMDGIFMNWQEKRWELYEAGTLLCSKPFTEVRSLGDIAKMEATDGE